MAIGGVLNTAWQAITANQIAMNVTASNIANVNTPGYTRQRAEFTAVGSVDLAGAGSTGINVDGVERLYNRYLETQIVDQSQIAGYDEARLELLGRVEGVFNETAGSGLSDSLNQFWNSWDALAADPTNQIVRYAVVSAATNLTSQFRDNSNILSTVQQEIQDSIESTVTEINRLTSEIAGLNNQIITQGTENGSANNLLDRRMEFLKDLADKINISYYENSDGTVNVFLANGNRLVSGNSARQLSVTDGVVSYKDDATETSLNSVITGGRLGAMIETGETTVAGYLDSLNELADGIVQTVNDLHTDGWANDTKVDDAVAADANGYTGEVSSGGTFTGTVNTAYAMKITTTGGNMGVAKYQLSTNGGLTWDGVDKTTDAGGVVAIGSGVTLTFDTTKPLSIGDTFSVNAYVNGIEQVFTINNVYTGAVSSSGDYTGDVNKTYAMKITTGGTFGSGSATYRISSNGGETWGANVTIPAASTGVIALGEGINITFADITAASPLVAGDIFYVNAFPYGADAVFFDNELAGAINMQVSDTILNNPLKVVASYDAYRAERIRGESWLTATESSLVGVSDLLLQAQEVAQNGEAGTARSAEIQLIINDILDFANTKLDEQRYLFSGTATTTAPFNVASTTSPYAYLGNTLPLEVNIGQDTTYNITGNSVFSGSGGVFEALDNLLTALNGLGASTASASIDDLETAYQLVQDNITKTRAMSSNFGQTNSGEIARQIAAARDTLAMDDNSKTFNDFYATLVSQVGYDVKAADAGVNRNTAVTNQLLNLRDSVSGVSMDEEVINLMKYQFAYSSAARLVKSANDMLDVLMSLGK